VLGVGALGATGRVSGMRSRAVSLRCPFGETAPPKPACTKTTGITADLAAVIAAARPGSVVCLAGGDYGDVSIDNIHKVKPVVLRAATESPTLVNLNITMSSGLRLIGLTIIGVVVDRASDITFLGNTFTGMSVVLTPTPHANILFDLNRLDNNNAGPANYEGRLTIRGYDNTEPVGVTIRNNHFGGGCSDGVQVVGRAYGVRIGPGNEFTGIKQSGCDPVHADPIQLYGAIATIVTGNYFHNNGDGTGGLASFAGDSPATVTDNVFVCSCIYPLSIGAYGAHNWLVSHNTFIGGTVRFQNTDSGMPPNSNIVRNNVWVGGDLSASTSSWGKNDHNLNPGQPGTGNLTGRPIFVGGKKPKSYAGFRLAPGSPGKGAASDGTDMGIRVRG
jgi:hypothetical protein